MHARPSGQRTARNNRFPLIRPAFTLVELLVVIAIIGMMGVVTIVNIDGLTPGERLRSAARKLKRGAGSESKHVSCAGYAAIRVTPG